MKGLSPNETFTLEVNKSDDFQFNQISAMKERNSWAQVVLCGSVAWGKLVQGRKVAEPKCPLISRFW